MREERDDLHAREVAAHALAELGGDQVPDMFVALLAAGFAPDPNDNIRGSILSFLWPDHIDAPVLFRYLAIPQRDNYSGAYQRFLNELPGSLQPEHLRLALGWVEATGGGTDYHLQHAQHDILDIALRFAYRPDVRDVLVRMVRAYLGGHVGVWYARSSFGNRDERPLATAARRLIARDLIRGGDDDGRIGSELVYSDPPLIDTDDIGWITELAKAPDERLQRTCGRCIAEIYGRYGYPVDAPVSDAVVSIEAPAFQEPLRPFFEPVELGSERAREIADRWAYVHRPPPTNPDNQPSLPTRWSVAGPSLARTEAGDLNGWVEFVTLWTEGLRKPIADCDEWPTLAPHDRERIVFSGLRYVQGFPAPDLGWLDVPNQFPWSAFAARSALQLLAAIRPAMLDSIAEPAWRRWCPVLVALTFPSMSVEVRQELFRRCATFEELATAILRVGRRDNHPASRVAMLQELPVPLPLAIHAPLLVLAPELGDDAFEDALELLLRAGNEAARELGRTILRDAASERAARAARVLVPQDSTQWSVVITRMQRERSFLDAFAPLIERRAYLCDNTFSTLRPQQAAELYLVLLRQYPPDDNPRGPRGELSLLDHIERLRSGAMFMLVDAGSDEAIRALEWLRDQEPGRETLRYRLVEARQKLADTTWKPLSLDALWSALGADADDTLHYRDGPALEAVPSLTLSAPERRDASRDEIIGLLANVHVLIETATSVETAAVHASMKPLPGEDALVVGSVGIATYTIGTLGNYAVAHFESDMGNESPHASPLATNEAIGEIRPKLVLLVGIAFGLHPAKQRLGDVLVAQHVTSYEMVKLRPDSVEERGETLRADLTLIERVQAHERTWRFPRAGRSVVAVHIGQVLSGAKLVNNREFRDALVRRFPTALGGEMEGIGAYAAAFRHRVPVLLVKAICDWADGTKDDHAQPFAAMAATDLVRHVLERPDALAAIGVAAHR